MALVINDLSNPFFAEFAAGVDEALAAAGYVTLLGSTGESAERQQAVLASLLEHDPAGIILSPAEGSDGARLRGLLGAHMPMLVFNRELGADWDFLALDNVRGARMATEHLLSLGHRRIAFFGGHQDSSSCRQRREGYREALAAAGVTPEPQWLVECAPTRLEAARQTGALFVRDPAPTAAVCYNDAVALGLMAGLATRGRRAGQDFAVTGFDDIPEAAVSAPPLTTIAVDPRARGRQAAELILQRCAIRPMRSPRPSRPCIAGPCQQQRLHPRVNTSHEADMTRRRRHLSPAAAIAVLTIDLLHLGRAHQPQRRADPASESRVRDELRADDADPVHLLRRLLR